MTDDATTKRLQRKRWEFRGGSGNLQPFRVMGVIEGWVMLRRPSSSPILRSISAFASGGMIIPVDEEGRPTGSPNER